MTRKIIGKKTERYHVSLVLSSAHALVDLTLLIGVSVAFLITSCSTEDGSDADRNTPVKDTAETTVDVATGEASETEPKSTPKSPSPGPSPKQPVICKKPAEAPDKIRSTADLIALINLLPRPVKIPCLIQALDRPLKLVATNSRFSAQPADGDGSPRIFFVQDDFIMSVVPSGQAENLFEVSELESSSRSIKGELLFPITEQLGPLAAFERVLSNETNVTTCGGFCHQGERVATDSLYGGKAFSSQALRPKDSTLIPFSMLQLGVTNCGSFATQRCDVLRAIFLDGGAEAGEFPRDMPTFDISDVEF